MPVYEYRCQQCEKVFEYQQRMADAPKTTCEECAGALERLISRSSFSFKGGGWYKDLYATPKSDAPSTTTETKTETKTDAAPASTTTSTTTKTDSSGSGSGSAGGSSAAAAPAK